MPPVYVAATAPKMQALAGEIGDGCLTPSITTPAFVRYTRENVARDIDIGCTIVASIHESDRDAGRDGAREIAGMYLANKVQNIQGAADTLLDLAGITQDEIRPVAEAMERGGRLAAKAEVTDELLDKCKPIAGTPEDCIAAIEEYKESGCTHVMLELWGDEPARADPALRRARPAGRARMSVSIDRDRLVDWASKAISIPSFTGSEEELARFVQTTFEELGLQVQWQQVEEGRANVLGTLAGAGGGPSLMFNGHLDTSYSGREPWLRNVPGFQPEPFIRDGRLYGLGISNMKGALACYVEAVRALQDAGVRLRGDLLIAAVCGEIEKAQYGDAQGAEYRGYAAGTRYLVTHGGVADMCLLGEPTEGKVVLGHFGSLWLRIRVQGDFIHTAFSEGRRDRNSILRASRVLEAVQEWIPTLGGRPRQRLWRREGDRQRRGDRGRLRLARLAHAAPHRPLPRRARAADEGDGRRAPRGARVGALARRALPGLRRRGRGLRDRAGRRDRGGPRARRRDRRGARERVRLEARTRRDALVQRRVGADAVRDPDRQLRDLDRADGRRARRESGDRRARPDGGGLRADRPARLRGPMKLVTFDDGLVGELRDDRVVELDAPSMRAHFESGAVARATGEEHALEDVRLRAPIVPKKFFHTAGNFREHEEESKNVDWSHEIAPWIVFFQNVDAIVGPDEPVVYPEHLTEELDYELELAVVIRKAGKWFSPEEAADYIGGYVIFNDITARDIQRREMRSGVFSFCKGIDTFCPLGPWIVTPDEIPDPHDLAMELRVNGEPRQTSHSRNMSVTIPEILSHYSALGYSAGDVVSTGTVSGVAGFSDDPASLYLKPGDVMEAEIERIGILRNPVVRWQDAHGEPAPEPVRW